MTCWYELPDMKIIGDRLKELYDNAQLMKWRRKRGNSDGNVDVELFPKQLPSRSGSRVNRKTSPPNPLIYVSKSPNFCEPDKKRGILGTSGRQCNRDSEGPDGCKELCCNRGYYSTNQTVRKYRKSLNRIFENSGINSYYLKWNLSRENSTDIFLDNRTMQL